jgi:hypothetical protein
MQEVGRRHREAQVSKELMRHMDWLVAQAKK